MCSAFTSTIGRVTPSYADESAYTVSYDVALDEFKVLIADCEQAWRNFTRAAVSADVDPAALTKLIRELIRRSGD